MTVQFMNMLWSIEFRIGVGFDIESTSSRPIWIIKDGDIAAGEFDGLVICIPFFVITIGNVWSCDQFYSYLFERH